MNQNNKNDQETSISMDLENLRQKYSNLLIQYKGAVADYVNYLNVQAQQPCGNFTSNSKGIDQKCYDYIWSKAGCTTTGITNANTDWAKNQTLNGLIQDSWYWATWGDYQHRMGCYGNPGNPYVIICVGTDGRLYSRQGLDSPWQYVNDDSNGNIRTIFTGNDGKTIFCTNVADEIWYKSSWDAPNWQGPVPGSCCVISAAMGQDGTIVGVGTDNTLWSRPLDGTWTHTNDPNGEWCAAVAIGPDGSLFVVGGGNQIWKKNSYQNLPSQTWQGEGSCCVKAITIAPDGTFIGVGMDDRLYTKANYKDLSTNWSGPYDSQNSSCCAVSITTVANTNFNDANYVHTSAPNYKINSEQYTSIKGSVFWGTGQVGFNNSATVGECQASCATTDGCTGATFNPTDHGEPMCWLRGGDGSIINQGTAPNDYALVPKSKQLLLNMEDINQQLIDANKELLQKINLSKPIFERNTQEGINKNQDLLDNYKNLTAERENILELLKQYETLDNTENENQIKITQNYYTYILLLILAVLIVFLLVKVGSPKLQSVATTIQSGGELGSNTYYIIFAIILIIVGINIFSKYFL